MIPTSAIVRPQRSISSCSDISSKGPKLLRYSRSYNICPCTGVTELRGMAIQSSCPIRVTMTIKASLGTKSIAFQLTSSFRAACHY
jgi:hypothetical protein